MCVGDFTTDLHTESGTFSNNFCPGDMGWVLVLALDLPPSHGQPLFLGFLHVSVAMPSISHWSRRSSFLPAKEFSCEGQSQCPGLEDLRCSLLRQSLSGAHLLKCNPNKEVGGWSSEGEVERGYRGPTSPITTIHLGPFYRFLQTLGLSLKMASDHCSGLWSFFSSLTGHGPLYLKGQPHSV